MASPQKENGFTPIANELLEALCRIRISGEARQVLDAIIRKTYGFNKSEDRIALSQICLLTGLKKQVVCRSLNKLFDMKLVIKKDTDMGNIYKFNKDFDQWKPLSKKITVLNNVNGGYSIKITKGTQKRDIQKTITKDNIQKKQATSRKEKKFNPLGEELLKAFEVVDHKNSTYYGNITQRKACDYLISTYSLEEVLKRVSFLPKSNTMPFFPKIHSPYDLKEKWQSLHDKVNEKKAELKNKAPKIWL